MTPWSAFSAASGGALLLSGGTRAASQDSATCMRKGVLPQYTNEESDWSWVLNQDHSIPEAYPEDFTWDGKPIAPGNPFLAGRVALQEKVCENKKHLIGLREVYDAKKPFCDEFNPTVAEVDRWHADVINHIHDIFGYEKTATPDECLFSKALWGSTYKWKTYVENTKNGGDCGGWSGNWDKDCKGECTGAKWAHCGHSHKANDCNTASGAEGVFGFSQDSPWATRLSEKFCDILTDEGYWGGHVGPFMRRQFFGVDFYTTPDNKHENLRAKWGGEKQPYKYDQQFTLHNIPVNTNYGDICGGMYHWDVFPEGTDYKDKNPENCYAHILKDDRCDKGIVTMSDNDGACACIPLGDSEKCEMQGNFKKFTWDLRSCASDPLADLDAPAPCFCENGDDRKIDGQCCPKGEHSSKGRCCPEGKDWKKGKCRESSRVRQSKRDRRKKNKKPKSQRRKKNKK